MEEKRLPFLTKSYPCPACGKEGTHRQFRNRVFTAGEVESDSHVVDYQWNDARILQVHPPLYFLHFCTSCHFSGGPDNFIEPENVPYSRVCVRCHLTARESGDPLIDLLGNRIDYDTVPFESALWMHLLAIYIQLLPEDDMRDHYMIGRLYLRVAWLYREASVATKAGAEPQAAVAAEDVSRRAVLDAMKRFDDALQESHDERKQIVNALKADEGRRGGTDAALYEKALDTTARLLEALDSESHRLKSTFSQSCVSSLKSDDRSYSAAFLDEIKGASWADVPTEEGPALRSAIDHFESAIASDARLDNIGPYFKTSSLIVDLELRCGDLDEAFKKARGVANSVMSDREKLLERMGKTEDESRKMALKSVLLETNSYIEKAKDLQYLVADRLIDRDMPRIKAILKEHEQSATGKKKVALLGAGISHPIVNRLEERKMI
jgi:hypothetical protein